jgi:hypothetical protein
MTRTATRNIVPPFPPFFAGVDFFGALFFGAEDFAGALLFPEALLLAGAVRLPEELLVDFELTIFIVHRL